LNTSLTGLEVKWRAPLQPSVSNPTTPTTSSPSTGILPWLLLIAVIVLPLIVILLWRSPQKHDKTT
jgi:hypothetical protein